MLNHCLYYMYARAQLKYSGKAGLINWSLSKELTVSRYSGHLHAKLHLIVRFIVFFLIPDIRTDHLLI